MTSTKPKKSRKTVEPKQFFVLEFSGGNATLIPPEFLTDDGDVLDEHWCQAFDVPASHVAASQDGTFVEQFEIDDGVIRYRAVEQQARDA